MTVPIVIAAGVAAGAVAAPWLLHLAAVHLGGPGSVLPAVPVHVTGAQELAAARLQRPLLGVPYVAPASGRQHLLTSTHLTRVMAALRRTRPLAGTVGYAALTPGECVELCDAFIDACDGGVRAGAEQEPYTIFEAKSFLDHAYQAVALEVIREGTLDDDAIGAAMGRGAIDLTSLGLAVAEVVKWRWYAKALGSTGAIPNLAREVQRCVGELCAEMDARGFQVLGLPSYSPKAVGGWVGDTIAAGAKAVADVVGDGVAGVIFSPTGLLILAAGVGGVYVWRRL